MGQASGDHALHIELFAYNMEIWNVIQTFWTNEERWIHKDPRDENWRKTKWWRERRDELSKKGDTNWTKHTIRPLIRMLSRSYVYNVHCTLFFNYVFSLYSLSLLLMLVLMVCLLLYDQTIYWPARTIFLKNLHVLMFCFNAKSIKWTVSYNVNWVSTQIHNM